MNILITSEKLIKEIQEEFNRHFPFLRIEFFIKSGYHSYEAISKISNMRTIGDAYNVKDSLTVEITPCTIVKEFENDFENKFGMFAQLYRKSGNMWQEITVTDTWTMKQQDKTGNEISSILNKEFEITSPGRSRKTLVQKAV